MGYRRGKNRKDPGGRCGRGRTLPSACIERLPWTRGDLPDEDWRRSSGPSDTARTCLRRMPHRPRSRFDL